MEQPVHIYGIPGTFEATASFTPDGSDEPPIDLPLRLGREWPTLDIELTDDVRAALERHV